MPAETRCSSRGHPPRCRLLKPSKCTIQNQTPKSARLQQWKFRNQIQNPTAAHMCCCCAVAVVDPAFNVQIKLPFLIPGKGPGIILGAFNRCGAAGAVCYFCYIRFEGLPAPLRPPAQEGSKGTSTSTTSHCTIPSHRQEPLPHFPSHTCSHLPTLATLLPLLPLCLQLYRGHTRRSGRDHRVPSRLQPAWHQHRAQPGE